MIEDSWEFHSVKYMLEMWLNIKSIIKINIEYGYENKWRIGYWLKLNVYQLIEEDRWYRINFEE